jgi:hypothetical protein
MFSLSGLGYNGGRDVRAADVPEATREIKKSSIGPVVARTHAAAKAMTL